MLTSAEWALAVTVFIAAIVELVETLTIVLAIGLTRGWRSTLAGVVAALLRARRLHGRGRLLPGHLASRGGAPAGSSAP